MTESSLIDPPGRGSLTLRAVALLVVLGLVILTLAVPIRAWVAQRAEIAALDRAVRDGEVTVAELEVLRQRWEDPAYVAAQARSRLHFVLPGEIGYTVIGLDAAAQPEAEAPAPGSKPPWFSGLWRAATQTRPDRPAE